MRFRATPRNAYLSMMILFVTIPAEVRAQSDYQLSVEYSLWGPAQINVSDKGIKKSFVKHSFSALLHAPDWKVCFYSDRRRKFCVPGKNTIFGVKIGNPSQYRTRQSVLRGPPETIYSMKVNSPFEGDVFDNYMPQLSEVNRGAKRYQSGLSIVQEEVSCLPEKCLPVQAKTALRNFYGVAGLPLQYQLKLSDGQVISKIKFKGWKRVELSPSDFSFPTGYQRVASLNDIVHAGISSQVVDFSEAWGGSPEDLMPKKRPASK